MIALLRLTRPKGLNYITQDEEWNIRSYGPAHLFEEDIFPKDLANVAKDIETSEYMTEGLEDC